MGFWCDRLRGTLLEGRWIHLVNIYRAPAMSKAQLQANRSNWPCSWEPAAQWGSLACTPPAVIWGQWKLTTSGRRVWPADERGMRSSAGVRVGQQQTGGFGAEPSRRGRSWTILAEGRGETKAKRCGRDWQSTNWLWEGWGCGCLGGIQKKTRASKGPISRGLDSMLRGLHGCCCPWEAKESLGSAWRNNILCVCFTKAVWEHDEGWIKACGDRETNWKATVRD